MPVEFILLALVVSVPMIIVVKLLMVFTKKYNFKQSWGWMLLIWIVFILALFWLGSKMSFS